LIKTTVAHGGFNQSIGKLKVFENRALRRILGPKRDEVTGGWRKLHNEELRDLYCSPSIIKLVKSGHVARMGVRRNAYRLLVLKPEGKRPLGRPRRRWVDNIKMDLGERGWEGGQLTGLVWLIRGAGVELL
jgi:hypothetical protein